MRTGVLTSADRESASTGRRCRACARRSGRARRRASSTSVSIMRPAEMAARADVGAVADRRRRRREQRAELDRRGRAQELSVRDRNARRRYWPVKPGTSAQAWVEPSSARSRPITQRAQIARTSPMASRRARRRRVRAALRGASRMAGDLLGRSPSTRRTRASNDSSPSTRRRARSAIARVPERSATRPRCAASQPIDVARSARCGRARRRARARRCRRPRWRRSAFPSPSPRAPRSACPRNPTTARTDRRRDAGR